MPAEIVTVDFHGARLLGIPSDAGALIPLRPLVEGMGLDWAGQFQRVRRDPILAEAVVITTMDLAGSVGVTPTEDEHPGVGFTPTPSARGDRQVVCLPLDLVPGFLFRINANRVAPELRARVLDYQRHCFRVLAEAFLRPGIAAVAPFGGRAVTMPARPTDAACASLLNALGRLVPNVGDTYVCYWPDLPKAIGPVRPEWPQSAVTLKRWLRVNAPDLAMAGLKARPFGSAWMRAVHITRTAAAPPLPEIRASPALPAPRL